MLKKEEGIITRYGLFDLQVCVPETWTDRQVIEFANHSIESGTESGWTIRKEGHEALSGSPERAKCEAEKGKVHIMLEC